MICSNLGCSIWAAVAFAITAGARPPLSTKSVHERLDVAAGHWTKISAAEPDTPLTLRIGLRQRNLERAEEFIHTISHPSSATYGQHWSPQRVIDVFAPSDEAIIETEQWLLSVGVARDHIVRSSGRNWIKVTTTVRGAESLLDTAYNVYENGDGLRLVACESYSLPATIKGHVDLVAPTIQFDETEAIITRRGPQRRDEPIAAKFKKLQPGHPNPDSLKSCSAAITPACLRAL